MADWTPWTFEMRNFERKKKQKTTKIDFVKQKFNHILNEINCSEWNMYTFRLKLTYVSDAKQKDRNSLNYNFVNVSHGHRRSLNSRILSLF